MKSDLVSLFLVMLFSVDVWMVYGIGIEPRGLNRADCVDCHLVPIQAEEVVTGTTPFEMPLPASTSSATAMNPLILPLTAPPANTSQSTHGLTAGASIGIGFGVAVFILTIGILACGVPYIRNRRRIRALQRAVEEVERGIEMHKDVSHGNNVESKENMVLESRVEIVVDDDEESERGAVDRWDGWDASWEDENDEMERGRKGMSLPRRDY